jgi:hypothetical protein
MKPVRVVTPGLGPTLPLRMVAAGTGPQVAITLFVIGEGRWEAQNFPNASIDPDTLTWDFASKSSDYATARLALLAQQGGKTWNNAFAHQGSLLSQDFVNGMGTSITVGANLFPTFAEAYVAQGVLDGDGGNNSPWQCGGAITAYADATQVVSGDCLGQGSDGGGTDGGTDGGGTDGGGADGGGTDGGGADGGGTDGGTGGSCSVPAGQLDAAQLACGGLDDIAVALVGLHPHDVWLTRLEANLPHAALSTDLVLQASAQQTEVSNVLTLTRSTGDPCVTPDAGVMGLRGEAGARALALLNHLALLVSSLAVVVAALARRRFRPLVAARSR